MLRHASLRVAVLSLALCSVAACSSGKASSAPKPRANANLVTSEEIVGTGASNLYDAIQRLRPQWLVSARVRRGGSGDPLQVYLDGTKYGTVSSLRQLSVGGVQELRYFSANEATSRYGTGNTGGAILVMMSKP